MPTWGLKSRGERPSCPALLIVLRTGLELVINRAFSENGARDHGAVAIFSTMQTRASKTASKMRCSLSWGRPPLSYLMGAGALPSGRCGIASCTRRWVSFSSKSATPPVGQGRDAWWGDWGAGKKMLHDSAVRVSSQPIFIGAAERRWKAYAHIRCPKRIRNWCECTITCLRRKRSYP